MRALPAEWQDGRVAMKLVGGGPRADAAGLVAGLLGVDAAVLGRTDRGKPIVHEPGGAACSFAHLGGWLLVGAASGVDLGVDLELVQDGILGCEIADTFFAAAEAAWLRDLPPASRGLGFTLLWTVKEAALKATGRGIAEGLAWPTVHGPDLSGLLDGAGRDVVPVAGMASVAVSQGVVGTLEAVAAVAWRAMGTSVQVRATDAQGRRDSIPFRACWERSPNQRTLARA